MNLSDIPVADYERVLAELLYEVKEDYSHLDHLANGRWPMIHRLTAQIERVKHQASRP